jgi:hypothetical protein
MINGGIIVRLVRNSTTISRDTCKSLAEVPSLQVTPPSFPLPIGATPAPSANPVPLAAPQATARPVTPNQKSDRANPGQTQRDRQPARPRGNPNGKLDLSV